MLLNHKKIGSGHALIIIHGLYGSSDNWLSIAKSLSENFEVFIIDQRNHGNSPHGNSHSYEDMKEDLNDFMLQQNISKAIIIGHSMGGKTAMAFAQDYKNKITSMIIVDIAPKDYNLSETLSTKELSHRFIIDSIKNLNLLEFKSRTEIDLALSSKISDFKIRQFILKNLKRNSNKEFCWKLNIETISKYLPSIMGNIDFKRPINNFPILFIKGENSNYICEDDMLAIRSFFPYAELSTISNSGHWIHAEQSSALVKTINYFILDL